jgi:hypothetical protein
LYVLATSSSWSPTNAVIQCAIEIED